jgi:hypothetical protein
VYELSEIRRFGGDTDNVLKCPECEGLVVELDDTADVNAKQKIWKEFCEITEPLLALIKQTNGMVMIDEPEERCKPDRMMAAQFYNAERERIRRENEMRRMIHRDNLSGYSQPPRIGDGKVDVDVKVVDGTEGPVIAKLDDDLEDMLRNEGKPKEIEQEKPTMEINGKMYSVDQITNELLNALDDDTYDVVVAFKKANS